MDYKIAGTCRDLSHLFGVKLILISLLFQFNNTVHAQTVTNIDSLLCKEWKLVLYEEEGEKFPPGPEQKNDKMIFYFDHKVKSIETENIQNGIWKYDPVSKILTITDNDTKEKVILKVIKITTTQCIIDYTDPEGVLLRMHMVPIK